MAKKLKVLDLFSGIQSVKDALELKGIPYEYYGIDVYSPKEENIILDLSQDDIINKLIKLLPQGWQPDFIWASPVCNKFSLASAVKGGNLYFEKTKKGLKIRENFDVLKNTIYKNKNKNEIIQDAKLHLKLVENMQKIIDYFNVDFVIENPYSSYIKYFLNPLYVINRTSYCMYGFNYEKPTAIFSNYVLGLKVCNHKFHNTKIGSKTIKDSNIKQNYVGTYQEKSSVPPLLIKQIIEIISS